MPRRTIKNLESVLLGRTSTESFAKRESGSAKSVSVQSQYQTQATWYIDPINGSDGRSGVSSSQSLKTLGELFNRIDNKTLTAPTVKVTILNDVPSSDYVSGAKLRVKPGTVVTFAGSPSTLYTGTVTALTNITRSTNTPWDFTDSGAPANYATQAIARGARFRVTSGANSGMTFWAVKDLTSKKLRTGPRLKLDPSVATYTMPFGSIATSDPYALEQLTKIDQINLNVQIEEDFSYIPKVVFRDLQFTKRSTISSYGMPGVDSIGFYGCDVGCLRILGSAFLVNCAIGDNVNYFTVDEGAGVSIYGGVCINGGMSLNAGWCALDYGLIVQGYGVNVVGGHGFLADFGVFDTSSFEGVCIQGRAGHDITSYIDGNLTIFGSGNATHGFRIEGAVLVQVGGPLTGFTITGSSGNARILSTTKTWAQVASQSIISDIAAGGGTTFSGLSLQ